MKRSFNLILLVIILASGFGLSEYAWDKLSSPGCQEWQAELARRVESYARLHLPDRPPLVQVQGTCGHPVITDALYFRWNLWSWRLGWRDQKPLSESDLRMQGTRELMQHPDMGNVRVLIRFDSMLDQESRKKGEELISRYLNVDGLRQKLEFRKMKRLPDVPASLGTVVDVSDVIRAEPMKDSALPSIAMSKPLHLSPLEPTEPQLKPALRRLQKIALGGLLIFLIGIVLSAGLRAMRSNQKKSIAKSVGANPRPSFPILFAPRVARDIGERSRELWQLLWQVDASRAQKRLAIWWDKDKEGLLQFLLLLDKKTQEAILACLPVEQVMKLAEGFAKPPLDYRAAHRAALRLLLDLARELAQCSRIAEAPLFFHLLTRREWQKVTQQLTRPRRRALADVLDKERASWLRAKQDLHPAWFQSGSKEPIPTEQLLKRIRSILQVDADQLREQLYVDREAMQVVDSYFAELTLDVELNSDLAMLVLGQCFTAHAGFGRLVERRDPNLLAALLACDNQQLALLLFEIDTQIKALVYQSLGERRESVEAAVMALEFDKHHSKSLRMQARSLQRFVERQVLVADMLCAQAITS